MHALAAATLDGTVKNLVKMVASAFLAALLLFAGFQVWSASRSRQYKEIPNIVGITFLVVGLVGAPLVILGIMTNVWEHV